MKLRFGFAALSVAALQFTSETAFAQPPEEAAGTAGEAPAAPADAPAESAEAPAESSTSSDASASASLGSAGFSGSTESSGSEEGVAAADSTPPDSEAPGSATSDEGSGEPASYVGFAPPAKRPTFQNETLTLRLGLIAQPQFEVAGAPDAEKTTKNLYLRRAGLIVDGTLFDYFDYMLDVDYPNLFKVDPSNPTGGTGKNAPGLNVQDVIVTFKPYGDAFKIDAGFMVPPLSHNALQGAGTLYSWDYFVNSFRRNVLSTLDPFASVGQSPGGRDTGVQLRGLVLNDHLEYRFGLFQGLRVGPLPAAQGTKAEVGGVNFFRMAARVQVNILDAEPGFFYQGTYLGEKQVLSVGGFYDVQDEYSSFGGDLLVDLPLGPGIVTAQANVVLWDGGNFIQPLRKHTAIMAEAGYLIRPLMLSPILRYESLIGAEPTAAMPSEDRIGGGLAFWPFGHNSNFKAFFTQVHRDPAPEDYYQVNAQWQLYF